jgi:hypothetical protein
MSYLRVGTAKALVGTSAVRVGKAQLLTNTAIRIGKAAITVSQTPTLVASLARSGQDVQGFTSVQLSGQPSQGATVSEWVQTVGPTVTITSANSASASYAVPAVKVDTNLTFRYRVGDGTNWSDPVYLTDVAQPWPLWYNKAGVSTPLQPGTEEVPNENYYTDLSTVGAAPLGSTSYPIPTGAIFIATTGNDSTGNGTIGSPYATLTKAVAMATTNSTIVVREGIYNDGKSAVYNAGTGTYTYNSGISLNKNGLTIQNYPGEVVWFDGSIIVSGWVVDGTRWRKDNWTYRFPPDLSNSQNDFSGSGDLGDGFVNPAYPCAHMPDNVWFNGVHQAQVATLAEVTAGKFYVDYANQKLYVGSNPNGPEVRASNYGLFASPSSGYSNITLRGFGVRRYAPSLAQGAMTMGADFATLENMIITDNSTTGVYWTGGAQDSVVRHCTITDNGNSGLIQYQADRVLVEWCLFAGNNREHFDAAPQTGGIKSTRTMSPIWRYNVFRDNICSGLWLDETVYDFKIYSNDFINNANSGLNLEISGVGVVADNLIVENGTANDVNMVWINTDRVQFWCNTFADKNRIWENFVVKQDNRFPLTWFTGKDSRQPTTFYQTEMTWDIRSATIKNNVFGHSRYAPFRQKQNNYSQATAMPIRLWASFGIQMDGNLYNRYTGPSPSALTTTMNQNGTFTEVSYNTLAAWKSFTSGAGLAADVNSVEITSATALDTNYMLTQSTLAATASVGRALPSDIATLIGKPVGSTHLGAWRAPV